MEGKCTILFDDPFWVGIFERVTPEGYAVARHVFGAEPGEAELLQFAREGYANLRFSPPGSCPPFTTLEHGFKQRQREARREMQQIGTGTFSQRALHAERERLKETRQEESRAAREDREREKFQQRQALKKEKHRGR